MDDKEKNKNSKKIIKEMKQQSVKIKEEIKDNYKMGIEYYEDIEEHDN